MIPFDGPSVGPIDCNTEEAVVEMEQLLKEYFFSKCLGWIIRIGRKLQEERSVVETCKTRLKGMFPPRVSQGWAVCSYIAEQVSYQILCIYSSQISQNMNGIPIHPYYILLDLDNFTSE